MGMGRLYKLTDNQFVATVNYQLFEHHAATNWWGELTPVDFVRLNEGDMFVIELENKRRSKCYLKKKVNHAVSGLPSRYVYHVTGFSAIE